jgi:hypothetical protein
VATKSDRKKAMFFASSLQYEIGLPAGRLRMTGLYSVSLFISLILFFISNELRDLKMLFKKDNYYYQY